MAAGGLGEGRKGGRPVEDSFTFRNFHSKQIRNRFHETFIPFDDSRTDDSDDRHDIHSTAAHRHTDWQLTGSSSAGRLVTGEEGRDGDSVLTGGSDGVAAAVTTTW